MSPKIRTTILGPIEVCPSMDEKCNVSVLVKVNMWYAYLGTDAINRKTDASFGEKYVLVRKKRLTFLW